MATSVILGCTDMLQSNIEILIRRFDVLISTGNRQNVFSRIFPSHVSIKTEINSILIPGRNDVKMDDYFKINAHKDNCLLIKMRSASEPNQVLYFWV